MSHLSEKRNDIIRLVQISAPSDVELTLRPTPKSREVSQPVRERKKESLW